MGMALIGEEGPPTYSSSKQLQYEPSWLSGPAYLRKKLPAEYELQLYWHLNAAYAMPDSTGGCGTPKVFFVRERGG